MLSEPLDSLVLFASAIHNHCSAVNQYCRLVCFLIQNIIVDEYLHYCITGWLPSEAVLSNNKDYLNDDYDF